MFLTGFSFLWKKILQMCNKSQPKQSLQKSEDNRCPVLACGSFMSESCSIQTSRHAGPQAPRVEVSPLVEGGQAGRGWDMGVVWSVVSAFVGGFRSFVTEKPCEHCFAFSRRDVCFQFLKLDTFSRHHLLLHPWRLGFLCCCSSDKKRPPSTRPLPCGESSWQWAALFTRTEYACWRVVIITHENRFNFTGRVLVSKQIYNYG